MTQKLHRFKAASLDEAYRAMRKQLGGDAVVVRTSQSREGGFLGLLGRKFVEVTAVSGPSATPPRPLPKSRRPSPAEKKYSAVPTPRTSVGSDETVASTVAYFRKLVGDAPEEQGSAAKARQATPPPSRGNTAVAQVLPFKKPAAKTSPTESLRQEVREMRDMVQVLYSELPGAGLPAELAPHYRTLVERGVSRKVAAAIVGGILKNGDLDLLRNPKVFTERLKVELRRRTNCTGGIELHGGSCRVVALVGPTGVGKTTNLAKLAASYALRQGARVALVTADTYRIAAPEQLRVYANIIGLPLTVVNDAQETAAAVRRLKDHDLVLLDTAGGSHFNTEQLDELAEALQAAAPHEVMLVLCANTRIEDLRQVAERFGRLKPTSLFFTKLDETRTYGQILSLSLETGLPIGHLSVGQNVPDDLVLAQPQVVADLILEDGRKPW